MTKCLDSIRLEWPYNAPHKPEEAELLRQLYGEEPTSQPPSDAVDRSIGKIIIKEELPGGFSGARVLIVIPVQRNGDQQAARVVKLGPRVMLETERKNYDRFVKEHLPIAVQ